VLPTPSFTNPSQSSSASLQISIAAGLMLALVSLQSVLFVTKPAGAAHATVLDAALPYPSPSVSA
jgi:hypothetical protein